jgi:hypothetical protein
MPRGSEEITRGELLEYLDRLEAWSHGDSEAERCLDALEDPRPLRESLPAHGLAHLLPTPEILRPQLVLIQGGCDA